MNKNRILWAVLGQIVAYAVLLILGFPVIGEYVEGVAFFVALVSILVLFGLGGLLGNIGPEVSSEAARFGSPLPFFLCLFGSAGIYFVEKLILTFVFGLVF